MPVYCTLCSGIRKGTVRHGRTRAIESVSDKTCVTEGNLSVRSCYHYLCYFHFG